MHDLSVERNVIDALQFVRRRIELLDDDVGVLRRWLTVRAINIFQCGIPSQTRYTAALHSLSIFVHYQIHAAMLAEKTFHRFAKKLQSRIERNGSEFNCQRKECERM